VIEAGREHPVVLVPSSDGGTALLLRRPPDRIPALFGRGSGARHSKAARERGLEAVTPQALGEAARLDLDTPEDARVLLASDVPCRTRRVLEHLEPEEPAK
jgi:2-phospho-L-lactate guanylyltransferase (CobY/MobA/RfbA family)